MMRPRKNKKPLNKRRYSHDDHMGMGMGIKLLRNFLFAVVDD